MVGEAENGAQALRLASELQPDFLLLDVQLPDLDGFEVTARLLEAADGGSPAVILTSSRDGSEFGSLVAQSGALGFVPKGELSETSSEACLTSTAMARLRVALWPLALLAGFGALGSTSRRTTTTRRRSPPSSRSSSAGRSRSRASSPGAAGLGTGSARSWWPPASRGSSPR